MVLHSDENNALTLVHPYKHLKEDAEELVLTVQGYLTQARLPPITDRTQ